MRRHIHIILVAIITLALAAPATPSPVPPAQGCSEDSEKRPKYVDTAVQTTGDPYSHVKAVLDKRSLAEDVNMLWDSWWHFLNVLEKRPSRPPIGPLTSQQAQAGSHVPWTPPPPPPEFDRESAVFKDTPPPSSTESDSDSENMKAVDPGSGLKGKAKVSRRVSGAVPPAVLQ